MKIKILSVLFLMAVMVIPAFAAYDMYLTINGVAGSPADTKHTDWIPVTEILDNTLQTAGTVPLVITKPINSISGALYRACLLGSRYPSAMLDICKDGSLICRTTMDEITITKIKHEFTKKDTDPKEEVSLSFRVINWEFYGADGKPVTPKTGWNNEQKKAM